MKKLFLTILVLGLVWSGKVFAEDKSSDLEIIFVEDKRTLGIRSGDPENQTSRRNAISICTSKNKFTYQFKGSIQDENGYLLKDHKIRYYCSAQQLSTDPVWGDTYFSRNYFTGSSLGTYPNHLIFNNFSQAKQEEWSKINKKKLTRSEAKSVKEIAETAKKVCEDFGYKPGTEKFADCAKEIYLKEIEQTETSTVVVQQDNSGAEALANELKRQRKQQAFDELMGISQGLLGGKSIPEVLGAPSNSSRSRSISCNNTGETISGTNKICYYSCTGSSVTTNVGAAQQCPLTINR